MSDRNDELGRHLGTLLKTAIAGIDTMREVVIRSTQTGRIRVDIALLARERSQLYQALGETVVNLIDDGAWPLDEAPESVRQAFERIKDVEGQLSSDRIRVSDNAFGAPRGFEPEAAVDYGMDFDSDEASVEVVAGVGSKRAHRAGSRASASTKSAAKATRTAPKARERATPFATSTSAAKGRKKTTRR